MIIQQKQPSKVYFDFLEIIKNKNITDIDTNVLLKINENALKAMIKVKNYC
jgi:hypothetical protein